jgi:outer membrane biosynthesis protein TonB
MGRPKGSKVVPCPKCDARVVAVPGETGICTRCNTKVKFTQKLMKELGMLKSAAPKKPATPPAPAPAVKKTRKTAVAEPTPPKKKAVVPPKRVKLIEPPKKATKKVEDAPKRRGRPPKVR